MSYEIYYDKAFIKVNDNTYIPFLETGSNNCYQSGKSGRFDKRERNWYNDTFFTEGEVMQTKNNILLKIDKFRQGLIDSNIEYNTAHPEYNNDSYTDNRFGYYAGCTKYGSGTTKFTFKMFQNIYLNGFKEALTIEEYAAKGITFFINLSEYNRKDIEKAGLEFKDSVAFKSTEQMIDTIIEWEQYYKRDFGFSIRTYSDYSIKNLKPYQKRERKAKEYKEVDKYYIIDCKGTGFFYKLKNYGFKYVMDSSSAKKFISEAKANIYVKKLKDRYFSRDFETLLVEENALLVL